MVEIVKCLIAAAVFVLICPFGWMGLLCLAMVIEALKG